MTAGGHPGSPMYEAMRAARDVTLVRAQAAEAEVERLRSALSDLLDEARDMRSYVPEYFAKKWHHDEALERAREAGER